MFKSPREGSPKWVLGSGNGGPWAPHIPGALHTQTRRKCLQLCPGREWSRLGGAEAKGTWGRVGWGVGRPAFLRLGAYRSTEVSHVLPRLEFMTPGSHPAGKVCKMR